MLIALHRNATTTPRQRAYIRSSAKSVAVLARELHVSETTIRRWRGREDSADRRSTPHRLATSLSIEEEEIAVELRARLNLSLDDALEVLRRCVRDDISRSALYRLWHRRGIAGPPRPGVATPPGRFAPEAFGHPVHTVLTDNGSEFTDRFGAARYTSRTTGTGRHPFDQLCAAHRIQHKLTKPYHPQTNGMVERFNRRLADAIRQHPATANNAGRNRFASHQERNAFIQRFVNDYNLTRLRCLNYKAPAELLANLTEHNTKAGTHLLDDQRTRPL